MARNITFRTQLLGGVSEFCLDSKLPLLQNNLHLVELIVLLARYQEEGVSLFPKVYLTDSIRTVSSMLPGGDRLKIGQSKLGIDGIKEAIKKCAPLAIEGWLIYLSCEQNNIEFGLFRGPANPISVRVDSVLLDENTDLPIVKVYQVASDCVEISCNNGQGYNVFLNHRREDSSAPLESFDFLISAITSKASAKDLDPVKTYLGKAMNDALRKSHGCLIAVTALDDVPPSLKDDGIFFDEPIDFLSLVALTSRNEHKESAPFDLISRGSLLHGMLNSDGIVLFDDKARVLGYNCFVSLGSDVIEKVNGGARKRAYTSLSQKVGTEFSAVFIQSQDGWSEFKGVENE